MNVSLTTRKTPCMYVMMNEQNISDFLESYFLANHEQKGIVSMSIGLKQKNNSPTTIKSVVFTVANKQKDLPEHMKIPPYLMYKDERILTDVIERDIHYDEQAFCHSSQTSTTLQRHRTLVSPPGSWPPKYNQQRRSGQSISNHSFSRREWVKNSDLTGAVRTGTLGGWAIDNQDGKLVGVSNNHVFTPGFFSADVQGDNHVNYVGDELVCPADEQAFFDSKGNIFAPGYMTKNNTTKIDNVEYRLGQVKRSWPHKFTGNEIDAAICSLEIDLGSNGRTIKRSDLVDFPNSYKPIGASFKHKINWATTQEINNIQLGATGTKLFKSSRTTGAVGSPGDDTGKGCELYCDGLNFTGFVSGKGYKNLIQYKGKNIDPSAGGDSGSFVFALFGSEWKVIGMHFAGGVDSKTGQDHALACRIDKVAELLDVKPWYDPIRPPYVINQGEDQYCYTPKPTYIVVPGHKAEPVVIIDGKRYYQTGRTTQEYTHLIDGSQDGIPVAKPK